MNKPTPHPLPAALALAAALAATLAATTPAPASAQPLANPEPPALHQTSWQITFSPRIGFYLPQHNAAASSNSVRRPTFGMELVARRDWYGARALFERSTRWTAQSDPARIGSPVNPLRPDDPQNALFFETVVLDAIAYAPPVEGIRAYMFSGFGSKVVGSPEGVPILPYSLTGSERARTIHGGVGFEAALGKGAAVFEFGDYYGRNGSDRRVHDLHVTLMARLPGIGDLIRAARGNEESNR